jgi:hypothetical protein
MASFDGIDLRRGIARIAPCVYIKTHEIGTAVRKKLTGIDRIDRMKSYAGFEI